MSTTAARSIQVMVNGEPTRLPAGATIADVVSFLAGAGLTGPARMNPGGVAAIGEVAAPGGGAALGGVAVRGIAVAHNGTVVPRSAWAEAGLAAGDRVEVLTATQGG